MLLVSNFKTDRMSRHKFIAFLNLFVLLTRVKAAEEPTVSRDSEVSSSGSGSSSSASVPYQLSLQDRSTGSWRHICGAVLIDSKTALTAAHCFDDNGKLRDYRVVAGITQLDPISNSSTKQILPLKRILRHPNYRTRRFLKGNDIAILQFEGSFDYSENVRNIWISPPDGKNLTDFTAKVSGWSKPSGNETPSNSLQEAEVRILSDFECKKSWPFLKPSMICTTTHNNNSVSTSISMPNTCNGDSGGPLVIKNHQFNQQETRDLLIGIVSFSPLDCEKPDEPNGFTKISFFYDWIKSHQSRKPRSLNHAFDQSDELELENIDDHDLPKFTAVSSHFFNPGTDYKVFFSVNPHRNIELIQLKCVLMANSNNSITIQSEPISLRPGESGQISIPLPREMPGNVSIWRLFAWSFTEESQADGYKTEAPHTLIVSRKLPNEAFQSAFKVDLLSVFIQTDKPVYKPEDLVRIRVITMGSNDLPHLTSGVNISITNSKGNLMKRWEQPLILPESATAPSNVSSNPNVSLFGEFQKKKNGLSSYEYQLSSEPILGNWTIQVEAGNLTEKMYFDVQKYILPKFQVKVQVPPVLYGSGEISAVVTIKVFYTNGKGLQGTGNVNVSSSNDWRTKVQQMEVKDGEATVKIKLNGSNSSQTVYTFTANVTEKSTGRWQIGRATVRVYPREKYTVEWINKPPFYKPGLPLTVQLKISSLDGLPVTDLRKSALRIPHSPFLNFPVTKLAIPLSGIATFTVRTPLVPLPANSTFQVQYKTFTYNFTLPAAKMTTSSGVFIEIVSPPDTLNFIQGNSYNFSIRSNEPIQPDVFHCLLWDGAAMEAHGSKTIVNNQREPATEFPFSLQIPTAACAGLKIFVYFEMEEGGRKEIISTSKSINTHNYLKIRVSRPIQVPPLPLALDVEIAGMNSTAAPTTITEDFYSDYPNDDPGVAGENGEQLQSKLSHKLEVEPGAAVEIHFETYPDSTIAIRGIDQSLLLLTQQDNDLTQEKVESKRAASQSQKSHPLDDAYTDDSSFVKAFDQLGIAVLSNERFTSFFSVQATSIGNRWEESEVFESEDDIFEQPAIPQFDSRLRTKFPETWLWEDFQSSSNSSTTVLRKTLPDTLNSWIISGFSLNPKTGLGVARPATITNFMPFFVTLNLPYSVIKYESFDLQVIVHNYLDRDVNVHVTLFNRNEDFDFIDSREMRNRNATRSIKVQKNHAALAHFVVTPMVFGNIPIEVKIVTEDGTAGDSTLRHLKVRPDGVRETRTQTIAFDPEIIGSNLNRNGNQTASLDVNFPKGAVDGASSLKLTVIGESMGPFLSTLDSSTSSSSSLSHLLLPPKDSGSANMDSFLSNLILLHYLSATSSSAISVVQQARTNLEKGYDRQLQFRQSDGSFQILPDYEGIVWLTSDVLRWFVLAQEYIRIDPDVIKGAINFIRRSQNPDGSFTESDSWQFPQIYGKNDPPGVALTAYITLALIKAHERLDRPDVKVVIQKGLRFISRQTIYELDDNYITNLVAATLMAGNHPSKTRFFEKMERSANFTTNAQGIKVKFWDMKSKTTRATRSLSIRMTSYALLAHLWRKLSVDASTVEINNWLLTQRSSYGGFYSAREMPIGLIALSEFALRSHPQLGHELHLKIRASGSGSNDTQLTVSVLPWNRMVLQEFDLPVGTKVVNLTATGSGPALIQMTETWYMPITNVRERDHFNITAKMRIPDPNEPTETELTVCVNSYHAGGSRDAIASIPLPSGYTFYPEDYEQGSDFMMEKPENVVRFELSEGNTKMDVYFSEIPQNPPTCLSLQATQQFEVANAKNPVIHVYEYLNPTRKAQIVYEPAHKVTKCQLCRSTGACNSEDCD